MTDNTDGSELTQRKVGKDEGTADESKEETEVEESKKQTKPKTREDFDATWKYHWYIFRYYHYQIAETLDLYASAACLWVINLYLRLFMGIGPEPPSALTETAEE